ncbi:hypothetical protein [Micrococcus luteus]|uniref:hypothetical protein n=1 Tax=Micrococcus luteus TaxID=1270 RepID=UPI0033195A4D
MAVLSILTGLGAVTAAGVSIWASRRRITWLAALAVTVHLAAVAATVLLFPTPEPTPSPAPEPGAALET